MEERLHYIGEVEGIEAFGKTLTVKREKRKVFSIRKEFETEEELELLVRELGKQSRFSYSLVLGRVGLLMKRGDSYRKYSGVYLKSDEFSEEKLEEQQAGEYLVIYFKGRREDSYKYYRMLEEYIERNEVKVDEIYYEMALASSSPTLKEKEYIRMIEVRKR